MFGVGGTTEQRSSHEGISLESLMTVPEAESSEVVRTLDYI